MKTKRPYTYPHKSHKAIIDYLINHKDYKGWNHPYRGYSPLAWNVKVYDVDKTGGRKSKYAEPIDPLLDDKWEDFVTENMDDLWSRIIEDAQSLYIEGDYCTYPGDDQGDWKFCFGGRSGGWLILSEWKNDNFLKMDSKNSWEDYLDDSSFSNLTILYKAVRCMDADFTREKIQDEVNYQMNFQRVLWEEEIRNENKISEKNKISTLQVAQKSKD